MAKPKCLRHRKALIEEIIQEIRFIDADVKDKLETSDPIEVSVKYTKETGVAGFAVAIKESEYWLGFFSTLNKALKFCKHLNLFVLDYDNAK